LKKCQPAQGEKLSIKVSNLISEISEYFISIILYLINSTLIERSVNLYDNMYRPASWIIPTKTAGIITPASKALGGIYDFPDMESFASVMLP
jgi:hypothetical protein